MMELFRDYYESPLGLMEVVATESYLIRISFCASKGKQNPNFHTKEACIQLAEYFSRSRKNFDVSYHLQGTAFQQEVWKKLSEISYGTTLSYSDIAKKLGKEHAVRAVAHAIGQNPLLILIPCHRVLGKDGTLTGYQAGLDKKQYLLDLENPQ